MDLVIQYLKKLIAFIPVQDYRAALYFTRVYGRLSAVQMRGFPGETG